MAGILRSRIGLVCAVALAAAPPLQAQYFGRNKVQYQKFDFQVLKTAHFDVYFYQGERGAATEAARPKEDMPGVTTGG